MAVDCQSLAELELPKADLQKGLCSVGGVHEKERAYRFAKVVDKVAGRQHIYGR